MYYYDQYGWQTTQSNPDRSTSKVPPSANGGMQANWTGLDWVLVTYTAPPASVVIKPNRAPISKREFLKLFTPAEYAAIKAAAAANATVDYYWQQFLLADFISKDDPDTLGGLQLLASIGLLAANRPAEIVS